MRVILRLFFLAALAGFGQVAAETSGTGSDLDELIREIRWISEFSPGAALDLIEQAASLAAEDGTFSSRAKLAAATAPFMALSRGYPVARKELLELIRMAQDKDGAEELIPLLRISLGDIASRHGEDFSTIVQLAMALSEVGKSTAVEIKHLLLYQVIQLLYVVEDGRDVWEAIAAFEAMGGSEDPHWRGRLLLMRARLKGAAGDMAGMRQALEQFTKSVNESTEPMLLKSLWILNGYNAMEAGSLERAVEFLEAARFIEVEGFEYAGDGNLYLLEAFLAMRQGKDDSIFMGLLEQARVAYMKSGEPGRYHQVLSLLLRPALKANPQQIGDKHLVALSEFSYRKESLYPAAYAHLANAELLRRKGDYKGANEELMAGQREWMQATGHLQQFHQAWTRWQAALASSNNRGANSSTFYLVTLLLLLVVFVLFLLLRMRTEHFINESLRESVEKSRLAEKTAAEANRLKSQFLSNVSHEIKTPMSGLVGMASILDELVTDPVQRKYLKTIQDCSRNLLVLVNDLLDLGRMESNHIEIDQSPFRPADTLQYCEQVIQQSALAKGLELSLQISPEMPELVVGDSIRFGQILVNLLSNAIKFTEKGRVTIEAGYNRGKNASGELAVVIRDTGIGIAPEKLNAVFFPFNQGVGSPPAQGSEGTGLGLAISKKLAELMGGAITVDSTLGDGAVFTVRLPFPLPQEKSENA